MFAEYLKRLTICILGLAAFSLGNFFGVLAGSAGTNAWNTLALGISDTSGISFGTSTFLISIAIIIIDIIGKGRLGIGTIFNIFVISALNDVFIKVITFIPPAGSSVIGAFYTLLGQTIISFATILYLSPALGAGPRDTLMIIIGNKFPAAPIGAVKFGIECGALITGILLGAPFGIGTVLVMVLQASIFQMVCWICHYEPRAIVHENLVDTFRRISESARKESIRK
ncbi:MAG: hypothetical protein IKW01_02540 [Firmicutes bacterium]|nr:hypothetical protein [Bacillota bacterium]